jgi:hypothetical protein
LDVCQVSRWRLLEIGLVGLRKMLEMLEIRVLRAGVI